MSALVSIIIRTKDEERWITHCLNGVFNQQCKDFEVILVDNESSDKTLEKAQQFPIQKVITCQDFRPGKALNLGIREAKGTHIACLSGHCIPVNERWLGNLLRNFEQPDVAGVYGRQEPMAFTPDGDKRDLMLLFGLDRKVQVKDSFFHNANSMIRRDVWDKLPFDETVTNIEDRVWAQEILHRGFRIVYEPEASVYHHHGVHHNGNPERCASVVRILEQLHTDRGYYFKSLDTNALHVVALVPVRGPVQWLNDKPLLAYTLERALEAKHIRRVIVSTDEPEIARLSERLGAEAPFIRGAEFSRDYVDLGMVLKYSLDRVEELKIFPDLVVSLEITFPFRPKGLLDDMIVQLAQSGLDSVIAAKRENKAIWKEREQQIVQLDEGLTPRQFKEPTYIELRGVGCVTHPEFIRQGSLLGQRIGIYEVGNPYAPIEVRDDQELKVASRLLNEWF